MCNILTTSSEAFLSFPSAVVFSSVSLILIKYFVYLLFILVSSGMRPWRGKNGRETAFTSCQAVCASGQEMERGKETLSPSELCRAGRTSGNKICSHCWSVIELE